MVEHFQSRTDMILWLTEQCPRPNIVRALEAGDVEFLGGFDLIPPSNMSGWIFKIRPHPVATQTRNVCILCNEPKRKYEIRIVKRIPWENWCGMFHGVLMKDSLQSGDKPLLYKELYDAAR